MKILIKSNTETIDIPFFGHSGEDDKVVAEQYRGVFQEETYGLEFFTFTKRFMVLWK